MTDEQKATETRVRSSLEDVITIAEKMSPICDNLEQFIAVCKHALKNDAQLRLLMQQVFN